MCQQIKDKYEIISTLEPGISSNELILVDANTKTMDELIDKIIDHVQIHDDGRYKNHFEIYTYNDGGMYEYPESDE